MNYYEIGKRVRKFRKARGLSQEQLAEKIDISITHMSHIETGNTKLSLPVFVALATVLEIHTDDLLYDTNSVGRSQSIEAIINLLDNCSTTQIKIIEDIIKASKIALDKHLE